MVLMYSAEDALFSSILPIQIPTHTENSIKYYKFQPLYSYCGKTKTPKFTSYNINLDERIKFTNEWYLTAAAVLKVVYKEEKLNRRLTDHLLQPLIPLEIEQALNELSQPNSSQDQSHSDIPTPTKIHKQTEAKKRKIDAITDLRFEEKREDKPQTNTAKGERTQHQEEKVEVINDQLSNMIKKYDQGKKGRIRANISKLNLEAEDAVSIKHNCLQRKCNSYAAAEEGHENFMQFFSDISNLCGVMLSHIILLHYKANPWEFVKLAHVIVDNFSNKFHDPAALKRIARIKDEPPSIAKVKHTFDRLCIADHPMRDLVTSLKLDIPKTLTTFTRCLNGAVIDFFKV